MPWDSMSAMCMLRIWLCRSAFTLPSSVSPSTPQFHEKLSLEPSLQNVSTVVIAHSASQYSPYEQDLQVKTAKQALMLPCKSIYWLVSG